MTAPVVTLNHINFATRDVGRLTDLLVRHFSFETEERAEDYAVLHGENAFFVVITRIQQDHLHDYPPHFHVGFRLATPDAVRAKHRELVDDGYEPRDVKAFDALGAQWTAFYLPVGDGMEIEVNVRLPL